MANSLHMNKIKIGKFQQYILDTYFVCFVFRFVRALMHGFIVFFFCLIQIEDTFILLETTNQSPSFTDNNFPVGTLCCFVVFRIYLYKLVYVRVRVDYILVQSRMLVVLYYYFRRSSMSSSCDVLTSTKCFVKKRRKITIVYICNV